MPTPTPSSRSTPLLMLMALQAALLTVCFQDFHPPFFDLTHLRIAVGDCGLALAMLVAICLPIRLGLRLALATFLILASSLLHYIAIVSVGYPFVFAEEYFVSFAVAAFLGIIYAWLRRSRGPVSLPQNQPGTSPASVGALPAFALIDLFVWMLLIGAGIVLVQRALVLTDVSGMSDPWESLEFATPNLPAFVIARIPTLVASLVLIALVWPLLSAILLADRALTWKDFLRLLTGFVALELGLSVIAASYLLFEKPWAFLPIGIHSHVYLILDLKLWLWEARAEFAENAGGDLYSISMTTLYRICIFVSSLLLVRRAGWRFRAQQCSLR